PTARKRCDALRQPAREGAALSADRWRPATREERIIAASAGAPDRHFARAPADVLSVCPTNPPGIHFRTLATLSDDAANVSNINELDRDTFVPRHIGPNAAEVEEMLAELGYGSLDELIDATIPADIRLGRPLDLPEPRTEAEVLAEIHALASQNRVLRSYLGMGYYDTILPPVIQRNILENPGWYTAYTPYQAEIAQGRLEALLNFQTMVSDLTALPISNASLLDEATGAAEAMTMSWASHGSDQRNTYFVSEDCH